MIWAGNCNRYFFKILKYVLSVLDNSNMEFWVGILQENNGLEFFSYLEGMYEVSPPLYFVKKMQKVCKLENAKVIPNVTEWAINFHSSTGIMEIERQWFIEQKTEKEKANTF